ncbi:SLBB domain-containing protein [Rubrivirga sp.]|uniref:polysaccharide biosynthesis/export family protein n=1 Tax=Rubrivirga sp. TaxID=1885344 RepID=UPI003B52330D
MALPSRGIAPFVLVALLLGAAVAPAVAQVRPGSPQARPGASTRTPTVRTTPDVPGDALALSGPVDPDSYVVGPGDVFVVTVGGGALSGAAGQTTATVTADGLLVIPQAGAFPAAGRTLASVRSAARAALRNLYRNVETDVSLAAPRRFSVFVSGAVPSPGRQVVSALGRVEDAVAEAAGGLSPLDLADYSTPRDGSERRVALRNVRATGRAGAERLIDLLRYYTTGDLGYNPLLTDGDAVFVPTFDPTREGVSVDGDVDRPGTYDRRPDDTAAAVVSAAGGPGLDAAGAVVRRTRLVDGRSESVEVPLADAAALDVRARDQISVRAGAPDAGLASAVGAVLFPGTYPIQVGRTTLSDLVEAAGGLTAEALVRGAYLERAARSEPRDEPLDPDETGTDSTLVIQPGRLSDLGLAGRRYYAEETAATPRLSLDLSAALGGSEALVLRDGDRLVVPRDLGVVRVSGQVSAPGYLPFTPGRTAGDYVALAGGPGPVATTVYTIDARTGLFTAGRDTPVRAGDAVFVDRPETFDSPEFQSLDYQAQNLTLQERAQAVQEENLALQLRREEREEASERREIIFQTLTTLIAAASTVVTAYLLSNRNP